MKTINLWQFTEVVGLEALKIFTINFFPMVTRHYGQSYTLRDLIMFFDDFLTITIDHVNKMLYKRMPLDIPQKLLKGECLINHVSFHVFSCTFIRLFKLLPQLQLLLSLNCVTYAWWVFRPCLNQFWQILYLAGLLVHNETKDRRHEHKKS